MEEYEKNKCKIEALECVKRLVERYLMNKKNTKKFIKRMINNYIVILDSIIITITYDRLEEISWTQDKAVGLGKRIELKNREGTQTIIGKVAKLKRDGWKSWAMLVTIEKITEDWETCTYEICFKSL